VEIAYPTASDERAMLLATTGSASAEAQKVMDAQSLARAQALVRAIPVGEKVVDAILALVRGARPESPAEDLIRRHVAWGPGPRAAQALMLATRARALLDGRLSPSLDDVAALAHPVMRHRMALNFSARAEGVVLSELIDRLVGRLG
jgi:MoxR-like ATPase